MNYEKGLICFKACFRSWIEVLRLLDEFLALGLFYLETKNIKMKHGQPHTECIFLQFFRGLNLLRENYQKKRSTTNFYKNSKKVCCIK